MELFASFLPLAAGLGLIAAAVWLSRWLARQREARGERLKGVGGWLRFFLFGAFVLSPLANVAVQMRNFMEAEAKTPALLDVQGYVQYKAFSWLLLAAFLGWNFWAANRLRTRHEPQSVAHIKHFLIGSPFMACVGDIAGSWVFMNISSAEEVLRQLPRVLFYHVAWYWYFSVSERVRNTYLVAQEAAGPEPAARQRGRAWGALALEQRQEPVLSEAHTPVPIAQETPREEIGDAAVWWYLDRAENRQGPVSHEELRALAESGAIGIDAKVWREGLLAWKPLRDVSHPDGALQATAFGDGEPSFIRQARLRKQTASGFLWAVAIALAVLLVGLSLVLYLPERVSLAHALGTGIGALLVPAVVVIVYSLWSDDASPKKNVRLFAGCCALLLAVSGGNALVSRGYVQRLINKDGMSAEDFMAQATRCARLGDLRCQEASWREYVRLRPEDAVSIARLGIVLNQRGKHDEAIVQFKRSIELGAGAYDLFAYYADSHDKLGHTGDAIEWAYKTLSVAPGLVDVRGRLAGLLIKAHRPYEALSLLQAYDSQTQTRGGQPYFTAQRISIETAIDQIEPGKAVERVALRLPVYAGHFFAPVTLGSGKPLPFMVDTGASVTTLSDTLLRESKAAYRVTEPQVRMRTADGRTSLAKGILIESMKIGPFELTNVPALACADCASLLGQASLTNFDMQSARTQGVEFLLLARRGA
ncbi:GYF domain-containing protein [Acidovorax sp. NCPPB 2350]|nr:GYF domain-containing protein [Acidovorax sp. NCPPB 2350]